MTSRRAWLPPFAELGEVDSIDGFVMVLSPWAVRELRFDESLGRLHGYDFDICCQASAAGKKVVTANLPAIHHHSLDLISDPDSWIEAYIRLRRSGTARSHDVGSDDWRARTLRAQAEAACAKGQGSPWSSSITRRLAAARADREEPELAIDQAAAAAKRLLRRGR